MKSKQRTELLALQNTSNAKQCWLADDESEAGFIKDFLKWWQSPEKMGPMFGYHPNAIKCWLIVQPNKYEEAMEAFQNKGINVTTKGRRTLLWCCLGIERHPRRLYLRQVRTVGRRGYQLSECANSRPKSCFVVHIWTKISLDLFHAHLARYPGILTTSGRRTSVQFYTIYNRT